MDGSDLLKACFNGIYQSGVKQQKLPIFFFTSPHFSKQLYTSGIDKFFVSYFKFKDMDWMQTQRDKPFCKL